MKIAPILAHYLYANKSLPLPGIGKFLFSGTFNSDDSNNKSSKIITPPPGISFESNPSLKDDTDLIIFISKQTGKMKALASSDLHSYLELGTEFLNIGKPFQIEGIGTLIKNKDGLYELVPVAVSPENSTHLKENINHILAEESFTGYEDIYARPKASFAGQRIIFVFLLLSGTGLAILGGYKLYKNSSTSNNFSEQKDPIEETTLVTDTSILKRTIMDKPEPATNKINNSNKGNNYKYILEVAKPRRAFERYATLKSYNWKVHLETNDSVRYKIFLILPSTGSDTTRILDSLTALNGRKVYIGH